MPLAMTEAIDATASGATGGIGRSAETEVGT
jgi:hypothetical protein